MRPPAWLQVKPILDRVLSAPAQQRAAILDAECGTDTALRAELEAYLSLDDDALLEPEIALLPPRILPEGRVEGAYKILSLIGRGGMGAVYLAERADGLYQKQVAFKILDIALPRREFARRFDSERRILARIEHPNIVRLIDAGVMDDRWPYFVLDLIDGVDLTTWVRRNQPSERRKLELFLAICDGVGAAHSQLIVHLDLKPGNVLVTAAGVPQLLDFGLAKLLDPQTESSTADPTVFRMLTRAYASPEQITGRPLTAASDIFSLGVILFELVSGSRPWGDAGTPVQDSDAQPPSFGAKGTRRDLEGVIQKSLAFRPEARYRSVDQLADDVRRYLSGQPVTSRQWTWQYRVARFIGRYRLQVTAVSLFLVILLFALGTAISERRKAQQHFEQVRNLADSLLFEFHDAIQDLPGATPARELVVRRALQYLDALARDSSGDAALKKALAESYLRVGDVQGLYFASNLGRTQDALRSYERALTLLREAADANRLNPAAKADLAQGYIRVASALSAAGDKTGALQRLQQATQVAESSLLHIPPVEIALAMAAFGRAENLEALNRMPEALAARRDTARRMDTLLAAHPKEKRLLRFVPQAHKRLGSTLLKMGQAPQARVEFEQALAADEKSLQREPASAAARADLALDFYYLGRWHQHEHQTQLAESRFHQALELYTALVKSDPADFRAREFLVETSLALASVQRQSKQFEAAETTLQNTLPATTGPAPAVQALRLHLQLEQIRLLAARGLREDAATALKSLQSAILTLPPSLQKSQPSLLAEAAEFAASQKY